MTMKGSKMSIVKVKDLMTTDVISVHLDDNVAELYESMLINFIRHLPVVDENEWLLGIISERDLLRIIDGTPRLCLGDTKKILSKHVVRDIAITPVATVGPDTLITEAGRLMMETKFSCLPVIKDKELVGILTEIDFIRYVIAQEEGLYGGLNLRLSSANEETVLGDCIS